MITFIACLVFLLVGFLLYGKYVNKIFGPDDRETPAIAINDGVDYIPMPTWKVFLIQLLSIAGTGPILFSAPSAAPCLGLSCTCGSSSVIFLPVLSTTICAACSPCATRVPVSLSSPVSTWATA